MKQKKAAATAAATKQQQEAPTSNNDNNNNNNNNTSGYFILGVGGLLISALGVYYQREAILNAIGGKQKNKTPNNKHNSTPPPHPRLHQQGQNVNLVFVMNYVIFTAMMAGSIALKRYLENQKILPTPT